MGRISSTKHGKIARAGKSRWPLRASLTTALSGADNDIIVTAVDGGSAGNDITFRIVVSGANTALSVSVSSLAITVNSATNGSSAATSTAAQVIAAIAASGPASALVTAQKAAGNDGSGVVAALSATNLAGGSDTIQGV